MSSDIGLKPMASATVISDRLQREQTFLADPGTLMATTHEVG